MIDREFKAACHYEYARESEVLRKAADLAKRDPTRVAEQTILAVGDPQEFGGSVQWISLPEWSFIWRSLSFPAQSWNELSQAERAELLLVLPRSTSKVWPLPMVEAIFLTQCTDKLKEVVEKGREEWKDALATGRPRHKFYPLLEIAEISENSSRLSRFGGRVITRALAVERSSIRKIIASNFVRKITILRSREHS